MSPGTPGWRSSWISFKKAHLNSEHFSLSEFVSDNIRLPPQLKLKKSSGVFTFLTLGSEGTTGPDKKEKETNKQKLPFNGFRVHQLIFLQVSIDVAGRPGSFHDVSSYSGFFSGNGWRPEDTIRPSLFGRTEWKGATPEIPKESQY